MSDNGRDLRPRIVLGVDGSERSLKAADWAARDAAARRLPLVICHVVAATSRNAPAERRQQDARHLVDDVAARVAAVAAPAEVSTTVLTGQAADALISVSSGAEMLVVGGRGGGLAAWMHHSTSEQLAMHAECPAVVVRGRHRAGPILVGVDGSPQSSAALHFAFRRADALDLPVRVLHAYEMTAAVPSFGFVPSVGVEDARGAAEQALEGAVGPWTRRYPSVAVTRHLVDDRPAAALVRESIECGMLAVGSRGRGGFAGMLLGSVSRHVLRHAECPVAVVRS